MNASQISQERFDRATKASKELADSHANQITSLILSFVVREWPEWPVAQAETTDICFLREAVSNLLMRSSGYQHPISTVADEYVLWLNNRRNSK